MTPLQRSLRHLRAQGWLVAITEHWNAHARVRQDLFGLFDLLAVRGDRVLGVQCTSADHIRAREVKLRANPNLASWLESDSRMAIIHGWAKRGPRGKAKRWQLRELPIARLELT